MSRAITVCHGDFGRLCYVELNRAKVLHAHREGQLLFLISGDDVTCKLDNVATTLSMDRAVAIDSFLPNEVLVAKSTAPATVISIDLNPMWYATKFSGDPEWLSFDTPSFPVTAELKDHLDHLLALIQPPAPDKQPGYHHALETRLRLLIGSCFESRDETGVGELPSNRLETSDPRIRKSLTIMNSQIRNVLPLDDIARAAGLSRPHFYRLFRDNLGVTPNVYMNMLRMEFALERLVYSDQPVTSIALDLGFASQASFTRFFGANLGIPPTDYRRVACLSPSMITRSFEERADNDNLSSSSAETG